MLVHRRKRILTRILGCLMGINSHHMLRALRWRGWHHVCRPVGMRWVRNVTWLAELGAESCSPLDHRLLNAVSLESQRKGV